MKLFLSLPITSHALPDGTLELAYATTIQTLIANLRAKGNEVFCVLERLNWRMNNLEPPEVQFGAGIRGLAQSHKIIVLLDETVSPGVQIELGYAYAKGIPIEAYQIGAPAWSTMAFLRLARSAQYRVASVDAFAVRALQNNS